MKSFLRIGQLVCLKSTYDRRTPRLEHGVATVAVPVPAPEIMDNKQHLILLLCKTRMTCFLINSVCQIDIK